MIPDWQQDLMLWRQAGATSSMCDKYRDAMEQLDAARAHIASLEAEKSQWAYHVMVPIDEHDRMEAALRAQGLSQEDREAPIHRKCLRCGAGAEWLK